MRTFAALLLPALVLVLDPSGVSCAGKSGAAEQSASQDKEEQQAKLALGAWRASQLMSINVYNKDGERIGTIVDMIGDVSGRVSFVILSHGGFLGIGDKLIPVPWGAIGPGKKPLTLMVDMTKKQMEKAPSFPSNRWPDLTAAAWADKTEKYYEAILK